MAAAPVESTIAVLTAAGSSRRMGGAKKEYADIGGESVLSRSLRALLEAGSSLVAVTVPPGAASEAKALIDPSLLSRPGTSVLFVDGGASRRASVRAGLEALSRSGAPDGSVVLIHDAARPWAGAALIERVAEAARASGAAVPLVPTVDTLKEIDNDGFVSAQLPRSRVMAVQTPQGFAFGRILEAHRRIDSLVASGGAEDAFTDDAEIWSAAGFGKVVWVPGDPRNRKITFPEDLK